MKLQTLIYFLTCHSILLCSCLEIPIDRTILSTVTSPDGRVFKAYLVEQGATGADAVTVYEGDGFDKPLKGYDHQYSAKLRLEGRDRLVVTFTDIHNNSKFTADTILLKARK